LAFGCADIVAGLMPSYLTYAAVTPIIGITALTMITSANTYLQMSTDADMRGRVTSLYMLVFLGGTPLGAPIVGWVGEHWGARWTLIGGGALTLFGVVAAVLAIHRPQPVREPSPLGSPVDTVPAR
jgi:predicted MFS family arabinose efflux permease